MELAVANILLVEDNRQMAELVRVVVTGLGATHFEHAQSAEQALDALERRSFNVVLLDRKLGDVDGLDLARKIRRHRRPAVAEVPIVMLTGSASEKAVRAARDAGVNGYLVKPFTVLAVHERLLAALNQKPRFIRAEAYVGPDRRRFMEPYAGPERRASAKATAAGSRSA